MVVVGPMQGIETHAVNCSKCKYMVLGIVLLVHKKVTHAGNGVHAVNIGGGDPTPNKTDPNST